MSEWNNMGKGITDGEGGEDRREERLQSLFTAAYLPLDPSEAFQRRVAAVVAGRAAQEARRHDRWSLPFGWGPRRATGVVAMAAAALLVAIGLTLVQWDHHRARTISASFGTVNPRLPRTVTGPQFLPRVPQHDRAPLIANLTPTQMVPAEAVPAPSMPPPTGGTDLSARKSLSPSPPHARPRSRAGSVDDLAFVNPDPQTVVQRWARLPENHWEQIVERVRRSVRVEEDFIQIPFVRIASASDRQFVAAVQQYKKEAAIVDPRLTQQVTLAFKGAALSDVCDQLHAQAGVRLVAGRSVADEKVTIFCEKTPLRQVMREVDHLLGDIWLRSGKPGEYKYELEQDLRSQLLEEELRNQDRNAALLALDAQMQRYRPYLDLSFDELRQRAAQSREVGRLLFGVTHNAGWAGMQLYYRLTPAQQAALLAGQALAFRPDTADPDRRLPTEWQRPILQSWDNRWDVAGKPTPMAEVSGIRVSQVWLTLNRSELGHVSLTVGVAASTPGLTRQQSGTIGETYCTVATGRSPSGAGPDNARVNAALRGQPPFDQVVSLHPEPSCPRLKRGKPSEQERQAYSVSLGDMGQPHVSSGDVWEAVHRATGLPIVADYYTRMHRLGKVTVDRKSLFEALCTAADAMGVQWRKEDGFLLCRSTSYVWDKLKEVPSRYLEQWARDREANGGLPLADFLEMATLSDQQLDSTVVGEAIGHCWGLPEWSYLAPGVREWARFLALLSPEELQRALQPAGLPFNAITPAQQQAAMQLQFAANAAGELRTGEPSPIDPGLWGKAAIYAEYAPAGWYVWRPPVTARMPRPLFPIAGRTAADALAAARRIWAAAPAEGVKQEEDGHFEAGVRFSTQPRPG